MKILVLVFMSLMFSSSAFADVIIKGFEQRTATEGEFKYKKVSTVRTVSGNLIVSGFDKTDHVMTFHFFHETLRANNLDALKLMDLILQYNANKKWILKMELNSSTEFIVTIYEKFE